MTDIDVDTMLDQALEVKKEVRVVYLLKLILLLFCVGEI